MTNTNQEPIGASPSECLEEAEGVLAHYMEKYFDIVWYASKSPREDKKYWDKVAPDIRKSAFIAMEKVEQEYPVEVAKLNEEFLAMLNPLDIPEEEGEMREELHRLFIQWERGFNSGCLAAFRFALTAIDRGFYWNEELEEWFQTGGIDNAIDLFPELDT